MTASNTTFTVFSGTGFFLAVVPLSWLLQSRNVHVGQCMYLIWAALVCLIYFVDSIVWNGNVNNWAPMWCDIATRIQIGFAVAMPACALCIIRRIYNIVTISTSLETRREVVIEFLITAGIPVLEMVMQYVVAEHRFNIYEDYGCAPATWNTPLAYALVYSWPLIISVVSACYGALAIRASFKRRAEFRDLNPDLTCSSYWRLIALTSATSILAIPMASLDISLKVSLGQVIPWVSWAETHRGYFRVSQYPRALMDPADVLSLELCRWVAICSAFVFFGFFGFSKVAKKNYRLLASTLAKLFGCTAFVEGAAASASGVDMSLRFAPGTFATRQTELRRGSYLFSDKLPVSTTIGECNIGLQPCSSVGQLTSPSPSGPHVGFVPRVPEPVLGLPSVWMPVPYTAKAIYRNRALDQV